MQAVVHDPNYAQAYVGLADCYNLMREYTLMPSSEAYPRALAAAKKAVELDDQSSEAHASLAFVSFFGMWDFRHRGAGISPRHRSQSQQRRPRITGTPMRCWRCTACPKR